MNKLWETLGRVINATLGIVAFSVAVSKVQLIIDGMADSNTSVIDNYAYSR